MTTNNYYKGFDISIIQGTVNFQSIADNGGSFVICRCGVGNSRIDTNYTKNIAGAKIAGLKPAAYHFIYPLPPLAGQPLRDPTLQAQYHWKAAAGEVALIDCEWPAPQNFAQWQCSPAQIRQWMTTYFAEYTRLDNGRKPGLYSYPYWLQAVDLDTSFTQYPLWLASYTSEPVSVAPWGNKWLLWQNSGGTQNLPGTSTPVDTDYARDLSLWETLPVVATPPPTPVINTPEPIMTQPEPIPVVPAQDVIANPIPAPTPGPNIITEVETVLKNNPGILNTIQNIIMGIAKKLFHIR